MRTREQWCAKVSRVNACSNEIFVPEIGFLLIRSERESEIKMKEGITRAQWQSSGFQHQRSTVRIQSSENFCIEHFLLSTVLKRQWLWLYWQSCWFEHRRSAVQNQSSVNLCIENVLNVSCFVLLLGFDLPAYQGLPHQQTSNLGLQIRYFLWHSSIWRLARCCCNSFKDYPFPWRTLYVNGRSSYMKSAVRNRR